MGGEGCLSSHKDAHGLLESVPDGGNISKVDG